MNETEAAREILRYTFETNPFESVRQAALDDRPDWSMLLDNDVLSHGEAAVARVAHAVWCWGNVNLSSFGSIDLPTRCHILIVLADWLGIMPMMAEDLAQR